jgi:hypothetical protein
LHVMTVTNCFRCSLCTATPAKFSKTGDTFYIVKEYDSHIAETMKPRERAYRGIPEELQSLNKSELREQLTNSVFETIKYKNAFALSEVVIKMLRPSSPIEIDNSESRRREESQSLMALYSAARSKRKAQVLTDQRSEGYSPPLSDADVRDYRYKKARRTPIQGVEDDKFPRKYKPHVSPAKQKGGGREMKGSSTAPAKASRKRMEDSEYSSDDSEKQPTHDMS